MTRFASTRLVLALPALILPALVLGLNAAQAQNSGPGYFIPHPKPTVVGHPAPARAPGPQAVAQPGLAQQGGTDVQPQQKLPPIPQLPALPKEAAPPAAVMGVLSVPQIMQQSTAAQGVEKIINVRRAALAKQAQAAGLKFENEKKAITGEQKKLSKAQLAAKVNALQKEIAQAQVDFHNRNVAIEISARKALGKIEATLIAVIRQVAQAHGMNLVLHRSQVALNVNGFDISKEVADHLNKILPSVAVPPSVVPKMAAGAPAAAPQKP